MDSGPSHRYLGVAVLAALLSTLGTWLRWVRKRPAGYVDGEPYFTAEYVTGLEQGIDGPDRLFLVLAVAAVGLCVLARVRGRRPDAGFVAVGGVVLVSAGIFVGEYWRVDRYVIEPGLYLLVGGALLFVLLGAGPLLGRLSTL